MTAVVRLVLLAAMAAAPPAQPGDRAAPADLVLLGGEVVTLDPQRPRAAALAARSGRIVAVGEPAAIRRLIGPHTRVIALDGQLVLPGFIEAHGHFLALGRALQQLDLRQAPSFATIVDQVRRAAAAAAPGDWIVGRGWHQDKWRRPPARRREGLPLGAPLDAAAPANPVMLVHASGHALLANARALAAAGIAAGTPDPPGGRIVRDADGRPTGALRENATEAVRAAWQRWRADRSPARRRADRRRTVAAATRECLRHGVTSFQDAGSSLAEVAFFEALAAKGRLGIRLWLMLDEPDAVLAPALERVRQVGSGDQRLTVRAIKRYADGALGSHGAWLLQPYSDRPQQTGLEVTPLASLRRSAELALAHDFQLCTHAIGDRANREVLDVYRQVLGEAGAARRWRIEHAQHLHPRDIPRFGRLGVIASMQAVHCLSDGPWVVERLGRGRVERGAYAWRSLLQSGARLVNGSDAPVEPIDPIAGFHALVTRRLDDGSSVPGDQTIGREQALRTMTRDAAWAAFEEDVKGSLSPGKLADWVVLSQDLLTVPAERIRDTRVLLTVLGGRVVHDARAGRTAEQADDSGAP
jgi:hypothetical protein